MAGKSRKSKEEVKETSTDLVKENEELLPSDGVRLFTEKTQIALSRIKNVETFRESDEMVNFVFAVGKELFTTPLDRQSPQRLIHTGGKLTGAYAWLGQMSARKRAERDVYKQKADEVEKELTLKYLDHKYKVTQVRAMVSGQMQEIHELVNQKEAEKNQWENITEACDKMVSFIQSAIKVKENERFAGKNVS